jgi:hypothetical protein
VLPFKKIMAKDHVGKPSGIDKNEGSGLRPDMPREKMDQDAAMTEKYLKNEDELQDDVKLRHPNRNVDKDDATNAGGYKQ